MLKLSILTLALKERVELRERLTAMLQPQLTDEVEWIVFEDDGERFYGAKMREGLSRCGGAFVAVVDDDDLVSTDYVNELLAAIKSDAADVITFRAFREDIQKIWRFRFGSFEGEEIGGYVSMMANHLCAWRRSFACEVPWLPIQYGADVCWYQLANAAFPNTREVHIEKVLYLYTYDAAVTRCQRWVDIEPSMRRTAGGIDGWREYSSGRLFVSSSGLDHRVDFDSRRERVIDNKGQHQLIARNELERLTTTILK